MFVIPETLKKEYGIFLRSIVMQLQHNQATVFNQQGKDCFRQAGTVASIQGALQRMAPAFPIFITAEDEVWINVGHAAMMKHHMVPPQLRHYYSDSPKKVIFVGLFDDRLSFLWLDGTHDIWIQIPGTSYWKPNDAERTHWDSRFTKSEKII